MPAWNAWTTTHKLIAAAAVCLVLLFACGNARAQTAPIAAMHCAKLSEAFPNIIQKAQEAGAAVLPLQGAEAKAFLGVINAEPPPTDYAAEAILIVAPPDGNALIFLIHKDRNEICGYLVINDATASKALLASKAMRGPKA